MDSRIKPLIGVAVIVLLVIVGISVAATRGKSAMDTRDKKFMSDAATDSKMEVFLGEMAVGRTSNEDVKNFASRMIEDHSKLAQELTELAKGKRVSVPKDMNKEQREMIEKLSPLKGTDFDRAYITQMVQDHKQELDAYIGEANNGKNPQVRSFAGRNVTELEQHLKMAEDAYNKLNGSASKS